MMRGRVSCACRVTWTEVVAACGLLSGMPPTDRFEVQPDWAGRPSLTVADAGRFVAEYRLTQAAAQAKQDALNATRTREAEVRQTKEAARWSALNREARREKAIQVGAARAVDGLQGLVTLERQALAFRDGAELAAELFDREHP